MQTVFEVRSKRVKGACLHPTRPLVACGLHSGVVHVWDYNSGTAVGCYEEHCGPVRGVALHGTEPLLATGGDDYKIQLINTDSHTRTLTLTGHLDYIRTLQFHRTLPWLLSASDDQTLRIWHWRAAACIAVLTGHNHYVMSAQFHPREDLIVSASLDMTVRVWDFAELRAADPPNGQQKKAGLFSQPVSVAHILEGHEKGVNWAAFHPSRAEVVSGSDDKTVRVWRLGAGTVTVLRGHSNNVSSVDYCQECIVSVSEDRTVRLWDEATGRAMHVYSRTGSRFWIQAPHPTQAVFVAGHDEGLAVFRAPPPKTVLPESSEYTDVGSHSISMLFEATCSKPCDRASFAGRVAAFLECSVECVVVQRCNGGPSGLALQFFVFVRPGTSEMEQIDAALVAAAANTASREALQIDGLRTLALVPVTEVPTTSRWVTHVCCGVAIFFSLVGLAGIACLVYVFWTAPREAKMILFGVALFCGLLVAAVRFFQIKICQGSARRYVEVPCATEGVVVSTNEVV